MDRIILEFRKTAGIQSKYDGFIEYKNSPYQNMVSFVLEPLNYLVNHLKTSFCVGKPMLCVNFFQPCLTSAKFHKKHETAKHETQKKDFICV